MRYLLVFLALAVVDFVWARYVAACAERRPLMAAGYAVGIIVLGGYATISYTNDPTMLAPAAAGAFVGTWLSVRPT